MSGLARAASVILAKELRTEFRTRELLSTTVVFVLMVVVLFSFTFDPSAAESRRFGPGLLWLAFLFAGSTTCTCSRWLVGCCRWLVC
ncbi:MAG: heme exporter protein CcmB [Acidobacteria bacterium]|nr:heme exporter protein CcmB [Acidobacteriota bacterium]